MDNQLQNPSARLEHTSNRINSKKNVAISSISDLKARVKQLRTTDNHPSNWLDLIIYIEEKAVVTKESRLQYIKGAIINVEEYTPPDLRNHEDYLKIIARKIKQESKENVPSCKSGDKIRHESDKNLLKERNTEFNSGAHRLTQTSKQLNMIQSGLLDGASTASTSWSPSNPKPLCRAPPEKLHSPSGTMLKVAASSSTSDPMNIKSLVPQMNELNTISPPADFGASDSIFSIPKIIETENSSVSSTTNVPSTISPMTDSLMLTEIDKDELPECPVLSRNWEQTSTLPTADLLQIQNLLESIKKNPSKNLLEDTTKKKLRSVKSTPDCKLNTMGSVLSSSKASVNRPMPKRVLMTKLPESNEDFDDEWKPQSVKRLDLAPESNKEQVNVAKRLGFAPESNKDELSGAKWLGFAPESNKDELSGAKRLDLAPESNKDELSGAKRLDLAPESNIDQINGVNRLDHKHDKQRKYPSNQSDAVSSVHQSISVKEVSNHEWTWKKDAKQIAGVKSEFRKPAPVTNSALPNAMKYPKPNTNTSESSPKEPGSAPANPGSLLQAPSLEMDLPKPNMHLALQPNPKPKKNVVKIKNETYSIFGLIGEGGTSKVYAAASSQNQIVAIKEAKMEGTTAITSFENEIKLLLRMQQSDRVIKLYDYEYCPDTEILYLVMEKGDKDLASYLKRRGTLRKIERKFYWESMLLAVKELHGEGIVHSDLKPANFMLSGGFLKLIDFGISSSIQPDRTSVTLEHQCGTLNYMAPEIFQSQSDSTQMTEEDQPRIKIGKKSDVWSLGCILYLMTYKKTPFQDIKYFVKKVNAIVNDSIRINIPEIEDNDLRKVIQLCLVRNPAKRPSIDELLQHPYLQ